MANDNVTLQKIQIDVESATTNLRKLNNDLKTLLTDNNKSLNDSSKSFKQNETQIKSWGESATDQLKKYGEASLANIKLGAQALTLDLGRKAINASAKDAINMAFSFSKAFAEIKSRSNASTGDLEKWRSSLMQISVDTTANMDSMAESFKDLFSSVKNPDELLKVMSSIGDAAAMGDGDATKVSTNVKATLQGQGREVNKANVDDVLASSDVLRRKGDGYGNETEALGAMSGIRGQDIANSGMSMRQVANYMSAASKTSGGAVGGDVIKTLLAGSSTLESQLKLQAGLGLKAGKNGKLDLSSLGGAEYSKKVMSMGSNDQIRRLSLKGITGASDDVVQAFLNIAKDGSKFRDSLNDAQTDTQTFAESVAGATDNAENAYKKFNNTLIKGVSDIFGGFEKPTKDFMQGNVASAAGGVMGAGDQALKGIGAHPGLVAGALVTSLAGGALLKGVFGKIPGLGMAKGAAQGQVAKAMGANPVYVINAEEIGEDVGDATGKTMSPFGTALKGIGSGLGGVAAAAGIGFAIGEVINGYLDSHQRENASGQKYTSVEKGIAKVIPEFLGGMSKDQYNDTYNNEKKIQVELVSKDKHFNIVPSGNQLPRDGRHK